MDIVIVTPRSRTAGVTMIRVCGKIKNFLKLMKMRHILIYLKIMAKTLSEIIIFSMRVINIVYKKNIKFGKKSKFWKSYYSQAVYLLTGPRVPFNRSNVPWTKSPPKFTRNA